MRAYPSKARHDGTELDRLGQIGTDRDKNTQLSHLRLLHVSFAAPALLA